MLGAYWPLLVDDKGQAIGAQQIAIAQSIVTPLIHGPVRFR